MDYLLKLKEPKNLLEGEGYHQQVCGSLPNLKLHGHLPLLFDLNAILWKLDEMLPCTGRVLLEAAVRKDLVQRLVEFGVHLQVE